MNRPGQAGVAAHLLDQLPADPKALAQMTRVLVRDGPVRRQAQREGGVVDLPGDLPGLVDQRQG